MLRLTEWDINRCDLPGVFWHFDVRLQSLSLSDCFLLPALGPKFLSTERLSWSEPCISWQLPQHLPVVAGNIEQSQGADGRGGESPLHVPLIRNRHLDVCTSRTARATRGTRGCIVEFIPLTFNLAFYALQRFYHILRKRNRFFLCLGSSELPVVPTFLFISFN